MYGTTRGHEEFQNIGTRELMHEGRPYSPVCLEKNLGKIFHEVERRGVEKRTIPPSQFEYTAQLPLPEKTNQVATRPIQKRLGSSSATIVDAMVDELRP